MIDLLINEETYISEEHFCIKYRPNIPSPEMEIERVFVEGRDGELIIEKGYKNINYEVEINCLEDDNVKPYLRKIKHLLRNASTISFSDDDEIFYNVKTVSFGDVENEIDEYGTFTVSFELEPFQYFYPDTLKIKKNTTIENEGFYFSKPKFTVYGNGDCDFKVNGKAVKLASVDSFIVVDTTIEECYKDETNLNSRMTGGFPTFYEGENTIELGTGVTSIVVEPRWRAV